MPRARAFGSSGAVALFVAAAGFSHSASAQCTAGWQPGTANSDVSASVRWLRMWDPDGTGPAAPLLAAGGDFATAGTNTVNSVATWDGIGWSALGDGIAGPVYCITSLSSNNRLFVAGPNFNSAGGNPAKRVAQWDGSTWSDANTDGFSGSMTLLTVTALNATSIVITGVFTNVGPDQTPALRVAAWDSTTNTWSGLGDGMSSTTSAAVVLQNGDLVVGGAAISSGSTTINRIARWDGSTWNAMGSGLNGLVRCFVVMPNGDLIVGGAFTASGDGSIPLNHLARWNAVDGWSQVGGGTSGTATLTAVPDPYALAVASNGDLLVAGDFTTVGVGGSTPANRVASWNGTTWSAFGTGLNAAVRAMAVLPSGDVAVGGDFTTAGGVAANKFAIWSSQSPVAISDEPDTVTACATATSAVFTLTATGTSPTYQWQQQDLLNLPNFINITDGPVLDPFSNAIATASGTNSPTLTLTDLTGVAQIFRCVVSNSCSTVESAEVTLTFCRVDFDCSGTVAVQDIFDFLNAWFAGSEQADFDGGGLAVSDIFEFLNEWFTGC